MIQGNVEEALNLGGVEVHGQHTVGAGGGDHVGDQLCGDGVAALGLTVLTGVAKIGDNGGNTASGCTAAGIGHHQQLHQGIVDRFAGGLNQEYICTADGFIQGHGYFAISKGFDLCLSQRNAQSLADCFSELWIGIAAENLDVISVSSHQRNTSLYSISAPRSAEGAL